jgi:Cu-Zn family superoxide dismutase
MKSRWLIISACMLLPACADMSGAFTRSPSATATLAPTKGNTVGGTVNFTQKSGYVLVEAQVSGLKANGTHGFHIHEKGNCSGDASGAGGHFNPSGSQHGAHDSPTRHGGDLGNLKADANGLAKARVEVTGISLGTDANSIIGRAVVIHGGPDDLQSQPAGNAGPRIGCGLISKNPDKVF